MEKKTKWMVGGGAAIVAVIAVVVLLGKGGGNITVTTEVVHRGDLVQTVDVTGEVESLQDIDLAFATTGNVGEILADSGDRVTAGQTLATLDAHDLGADVAHAQAVLAQQLAGATDEEIAVSEAQVRVANAALSAAQADLAIKEADVVRVTASEAASVESASLAADKAQDDVDRAGTENDLAVSQARQDFVISLESAAIAVRSALSDADQVLGRENSLQNNDCEDMLGRQDPTTVSAANFAFDSAANARDSAEDAVYAITALSTDADIAAVQLLTEDAIQKTATALLYVAQALDQTVSDTVSCSINDVTTYKTTIEAARDSLQTQTSAVTNGEQAYELAQVTAESEELTAQHTLAAATQSFAAAQIAEENNIAAAEALVTIAQASVVSRQADVAQAEASLAQVKATPRAVDLASLRADVAAAQARYAKSIITSPISGILTNIVGDVGELASAGSTFITVHADAGQFKIPVNISESDIAKVSVGDSAVVTFDAFGDDRSFTATVASINPAENIIEGVVFYKATIVLTGDEARDDVRSGMSANVTITTATAPDVLYVPQRAVLEENGTKYVRIPTDDQGSFAKRTVTVGMRADDGYVEIQSGLNEGETIIVSLKEN